ncbi:MAG TPA: rod shape-determining protein MreD [Rectinemataceae bacterium]|nr:rod shape-determining protein MreD [Rectinemataceae bacterium]
MMLRLVVSVVILVGLSLIQATWLPSIAILGARPDLGLLAVVWLAYRNGPVEGSAAGFISGLVDDAMSAAPFGFNAAVKTLSAWLASFLHGSIQLDRVIMPVLLGAATTLFKAVWSTFLALLFGNQLASYDFGGRILWVETAYNAVLAPILFAILGGIFSIVDSKRRNAS